jgi:hypothetical protein
MPLQAHGALGRIAMNRFLGMTWAGSTAWPRP